MIVEPGQQDRACHAYPRDRGSPYSVCTIERARGFRYHKPCIDSVPPWIPDAQRTKVTGDPLRGRSPACVTSALSDRLGAKVTVFLFAVSTRDCVCDRGNDNHDWEGKRRVNYRLNRKEITFVSTLCPGKEKHVNKHSHEDAHGAKGCVGTRTL